MDVFGICEEVAWPVTAVSLVWEMLLSNNLSLGTRESYPGGGADRYGSLFFQIQPHARISEIVSWMRSFNASVCCGM